MAERLYAYLRVLAAYRPTEENKQKLHQMDQKDILILIYTSTYSMILFRVHDLLYVPASQANCNHCVSIAVHQEGSSANSSRTSFLLATSALFTDPGLMQCTRRLPSIFKGGAIRAWHRQPNTTLSTPYMSTVNHSATIHCSLSHPSQQNHSAVSPKH